MFKNIFISQITRMLFAKTCICITNFSEFKILSTSDNSNFNQIYSLSHFHQVNYILFKNMSSNCLKQFLHLFSVLIVWSIISICSSEAVTIPTFKNFFGLRCGENRSCSLTIGSSSFVRSGIQKQQWKI